MRLRPRLEVYFDGVPMLWIEDPRTNDTDTITLAFWFDNQYRYLPWPNDANGQPVNPWTTSLDSFMEEVKSTGSKSLTGQSETWRDRPPLL